MVAGDALSVQRIATLADIDAIAFRDGMALVEVPIDLVEKLPLKNAFRGRSPRLAAVLESIRANGYNGADPIIVRIGRRGRWVVVDGGHRITAAEKVSHEWLTNLFARKVRALQFLLFTTPLSRTLLREG